MEKIIDIDYCMRMRSDANHKYMGYEWWLIRSMITNAEWFELWRLMLMIDVNWWMITIITLLFCSFFFFFFYRDDLVQLDRTLVHCTLNKILTFPPYHIQELNKCLWSLVGSASDKQSARGSWILFMSATLTFSDYLKQRLFTSSVHAPLNNLNWTSYLNPVKVTHCYTHNYPLALHHFFIRQIWGPSTLSNVCHSNSQLLHRYDTGLTYVKATLTCSTGTTQD